MIPRPYQLEAEEAVFSYWQEEAGNPLVDLATGCGKSLVMARLIQRLLDGWPDLRIMVVTHVAELIEQNYLELVGIWPFAPAGLFSAGLGRRDAKSQIIFAGIQTVHNKAEAIGYVDVIMVDEAHLIPVNAETMYGRFIAAMRAVNPDLKILGLTATPFRLDSGRLDEGEDRLFDKVVYTYGIADGIRDGYLAPLSSKGTDTTYDLKGVGKLGGDYKQGALAAAVDKEDVYEAAVAEIVTKGADRRSWLVFGAGVENALHIRDAIRRHGVSCETITGETPKEERRRILEAYKRYEIRALTNNSVLTTGFNHKGVDLIAFCRPTLSVSLYVQMAGRGTRPLYAPGMPLDTVEQRLAAIAAGPKPNCRVLDFAGLSWAHGPVDLVQPKTPGKGDGEAPVKLCPECEEILHISIMKCTCCGYVFPPNDEEKIARTASNAPIVSTETDMWRAVTGPNRYVEHPGKDGKPNSVKCTTMCGFLAINSWLCPGHTGFAKHKADRFWRDHGGQLPFPANAQEWLLRQLELNDTTEIELEYNGKYANARSYRTGTEATQSDEYYVPETRYAPAKVSNYSDVLDDDFIPF